MQRTIRLLIGYDGSGYHGWQRQRQGEPTIQEELETGLGRLCGEPITVHGAGRTDAGVHAQGMVAHFHTAATIPVRAFFKGLNTLLPYDIRILDAEDSSSDFHSRFSALSKTYRYDFSTGPVLHPAYRLYRAHYPGPFQPNLLHTAFDQLIGSHDFSSFERSGSRDKSAVHGRGAVRTLNRISCQPLPGASDLWSIRVAGDGFLRQMVRIMVGTLIEIGQGKRRADEVTAILAARDRTAAGSTAPACGLWLESIQYPFPVFHRNPLCSPSSAP